MRVEKLAKVAHVFLPEDSSSLTDEEYHGVKSIRSPNERTYFSLKAVLWVALSIIAGMIIGQL